MGSEALLNMALYGFPNNPPVWGVVRKRDGSDIWLFMRKNGFWFAKAPIQETPDGLLCRETEWGTMRTRGVYRVVAPPPAWPDAVDELFERPLFGWE